MSQNSGRSNLPDGYRLHAYRIDGVLGRGGFGVTYIGTEEHTERRVAIKEYLPSFIARRAMDGEHVEAEESAAEPDFQWGLERFRSEARTLIQVRHPNVVPMLQYFEANNTGYLVMEYQEGQSLDTLIAPNRALDPQQIDDLFGPLLGGLAEVHNAGYLHRDIKPANIFVRRDGVPLLLDFGAARMAVGGQTQSLTAIISEGYAPYEQYESDSEQGPWSDLYAVGATMYRCMTGAKPPDAPSRVASQMRATPDPMTPIRDAVKRGRYPERQIAAVEQSLRVLEAERPQRVAEFLSILKSPTQPAAGVKDRWNLPSQGTTRAPVSPKPKRSRADRWAILGGVGAGVVGIGAVAAVLVTMTGGPSPRTSTAPSPVAGPAPANKRLPGPAPSPTRAPATAPTPGIKPGQMDGQMKAFREEMYRRCLLNEPSQARCRCRIELFFSRATPAEVRLLMGFYAASQKGQTQVFLNRQFGNDTARRNAFMKRFASIFQDLKRVCG